jgi:hypothetical protein
MLFSGGGQGLLRVLPGVLEEAKGQDSVAACFDGKAIALAGEHFVVPAEGYTAFPRLSVVEWHALRAEPGGARGLLFLDQAAERAMGAPEALLAELEGGQCPRLLCQQRSQKEQGTV